MSQNKKCFCIDTNDPETMEEVVKYLKLDKKSSIDDMLPSSNEEYPDDNKFMLTHEISDELEKKYKNLNLLSDLMDDAIKKAEKYENVKAHNVKVEIGERDSMTYQPENPEELNLNTMAKTENRNYKKLGDMGIFTEGFAQGKRTEGFAQGKRTEGFACTNVCGKEEATSLFQTNEAKYLLFIIAVLFLCSLVFRS